MEIPGAEKRPCQDKQIHKAQKLDNWLELFGRPDKHPCSRPKCSFPVLGTQAGLGSSGWSICLSGSLIQNLSLRARTLYALCGSLVFPCVTARAHSTSVAQAHLSCKSRMCVGHSGFDIFQQWPESLSCLWLELQPCVGNSSRSACSGHTHKIHAPGSAKHFWECSLISPSLFLFFSLTLHVVKSPASGNTRGHRRDKGGKQGACCSRLQVWVGERWSEEIRPLQVVSVLGREVIKPCETVSYGVAQDSCQGMSPRSQVVKREADGENVGSVYHTAQPYALVCLPATAQSRCPPCPHACPPTVFWMESTL